MKLSEYAKLKSISYQTAHKHWKAGLLKGEQLASGTIVIDDEQKSTLNDNIEKRLDRIEAILSKLLGAKYV
jgi:predicted site-specific integrase-resolvase